MNYQMRLSHRKGLSRLLAIFFLFFAAAWFTLGATPAEARKMDFNIPAQDLSSALKNFALETGLQMLYSSDMVKGIRSKGVTGKYEPKEVLDILLSGTGLSYHFTDPNTVTVQRKVKQKVERVAKRETKIVVAQKEEEITPKREPAEKKEEVKRPVVIEEMVVTAQKREENVQDVPMSLSVFSDIQVEDADIRDTIDLTRFTPNVLMKQNIAANLIIIRGISVPDTSVFGPAGYYVDGISYSIPYMRNFVLGFGDMCKPHI